MENIATFTKPFSESESDFISSNENEIKSDNLPPILNLIKEQFSLELKEPKNMGKYVEDYFFFKLKTCLHAKNYFRGNYSLVNHIRNLKESVLNYLKDICKDKNQNSDMLKIKGINLIQKGEEIFQNKSNDIQIDSLFPNISGKIVKKFLYQIKQYSFSSKDFETKIIDEKNYNLIIESTHNILTTLPKKTKQLRNYSTLFSKSRKLYSENKEMLKDFYLGFLKHFNIIEKKEKDKSYEELIKNSNFIYIICSNKDYYTTKLFHECLQDKKQFEKLIKYLSDKKKEKKNNNQPKNEGEIKTQKEEKNEVGPKKKDNNESGEIKGKDKENQKTNDIKNSEKTPEKNNIKIDNNENEEYDPVSYIDKFKKVLDSIELENDCFLLIYLDCYDKLFVPYEIFESGLEDIKALYKKCEEISEKYDNLQLTLKSLHPELFNDKGELVYMAKKK